jgi:hypothetical protein
MTGAGDKKETSFDRHLSPVIFTAVKDDKAQPERTTLRPLKVNESG